MIVQVVIDPEAFSSEEMVRPGCDREAFSLLTRILQNGVLISDHKYGLLRQLEGQISQLPIKSQQRLEALFTEILKQKKRYIFRHEQGIEGNIQTFTRTVCREIKPDALISGGSCLGERRECVGESTLCLDLAEYLDSSIEKKGLGYMNDVPPLDKLGESMLKEYLAPVLQCAAWLRIYDPFIGKTGHNLAAFTRGIQWLIDLWNKEGYFKVFQPAFVEIYTNAFHVPSGQREYEKQRREERRTRIIKDVRREFLDKLNDAGMPIKIKMIFKDDPEFHMRVLETPSVCIQFDKGFDLFKSGKLRRNNLVMHHQNTRDQLNDLRALSDVAVHFGRG